MVQHNSSSDKHKNKEQKKALKKQQKLSDRLDKARHLQAMAESQYQRAVARLERRITRVKRLEVKFAQLQSSQIAAPGSMQETASEIASLSSDDQSLPTLPLNSLARSIKTSSVSASKPTVLDEEAEALAHESRVVVAVAEEAAYSLIELVRDAEIRLDLSGGMAPHIERELVHLHDVVEKAQQFASATDQIARNTEQLIDHLRQYPYLDPSLQEDLSSDLLSSTLPVDDVSLDPADIAQDEQELASVTAMIIANAADSFAQEAEVESEVSDERTNITSLLSENAEATLMHVKTAIQDGVLLNGGADDALQAAEYSVAHARALQAEAEAQSERMRQYSMNADAELEVTEGMAASAIEHWAQSEDDRGGDDNEKPYAQRRGQSGPPEHNP